MFASHIFRVTPDKKRTSFGDFLSSVGVPSHVCDEMPSAQVMYVDIDVLAGSWNLKINVVEPDSQSTASYELAPIEAMIAKHLEHVNQVCIEMETVGTVPSDNMPSDTTSLPAGNAITNNGDMEEDDDYMSRILERAKDWVTLSNGGGAQSGSTQGGSSRQVGTAMLGKAFQTQPIPIVDIRDEERSVTIEGEVIDVDVRELRSGRLLVTFDVTDLTDTISAKVWEEENNRQLSTKIKKGQYVRVRGSVQVDRYSGELTLLPRDVMHAEAPEGRMDTMDTTRVELHLHTKMSALDGALEVEQLFEQLKAWNHSAVAITDHGVVQAFPEAYAAAQKAGIKLIYGVEGYLVNDSDKKSPMYHIVILAKNTTGLVNLYKLISLSHMRYFYRRPRLPRSVIEEHREGLIIGSACEAGDLYQAILNGESDSEIERIADFYDYLEIQPLSNNMFHIEEGHLDSKADLQNINRRIVELGEKLNKPVVATGDVHFLLPEHEVYRDIIMAGHGFDVEQPTPLYLRTTEEMLEEFSYLGEDKAYEVVVTTPRAIADSVEDMSPIPGGFHPPRLEGADDEIRDMATSKMYEIYGPNPPAIVRERLERELSSIIDNGYASLYLIAHKLVDRSLQDGYLVGSRGSVGSSFAATMCGITEVNPLPPHYICTSCHYFEMIDDGSVGSGPDLPVKDCPGCGEELVRDGFDIPFETFLGFHGDKVPDIDLNFSGVYQPKAHRYTEKLLGKDRVFRAGTIARLAERTAYGYVMKYLESKGQTAKNAEVNRLVRGCSGIRRTTGQHPGGLMVVPEGREIYEFTPIQFPANQESGEVITTHFDCDTIDDTLVKLDILGHDDPTMLKMLEQQTGIDVRTMPVDDEQTLRIFSGIESLGLEPGAISSEVGTLGVPEFGTRFVRQMLVETKPKTIAELIRISGLSHGTNVWTDNAQDLIKSKTCTLKDVIATRDDIMTHLIRIGVPSQDAFQIMEKVRRGRGVSDEEAKLMREHGVPSWYVESCQKISYMFPKAHAVAYVLMALRIAYFKVHEPRAFYAAYFSLRADEVDADLLVAGEKACRRQLKVLEAKGHDATAKEKSQLAVLEVAVEAMARGIRFLPVDLYRSEASEFKIENGELRCPFQAVPGLGGSAARSIIDARDVPFTSIDDLQERTKITKTVVQVLKDHGTLAELPESDQAQLF